VKQLRALVAERFTRVSGVLHDQRGVDAARVRSAEPTGEPATGDPAVTFDLGAVGS
jgi:hypothetical protein